jgi:hypothetical protein
MNLPPLISRVPGSVRESKMSTDEENPGAQYNEAGLEKTRGFWKKPSPLGFSGFFGFFGVFWFFFYIFAQKREFLGGFQFQEYLKVHPYASALDWLSILFLSEIFLIECIPYYFFF